MREREEDLTDRNYWERRQAGQSAGRARLLDVSQSEWLSLVEPALREYEGGRFLELGCSPGYASALVCGRTGFQPEGVDFSPGADLYLQNLRTVGVDHAKLHRCDVRDFAPEHSYDVVGSFGLIEHFLDPGEILAHHDRLLRPGGLCVVVVPNFRKLQYAYHFLLDRPDLRRHNVRCMDPRVLEGFALRHGHDIITLGYAGKLRFWNVDMSGGRLRCGARRLFAKAARALAKGTSWWLPEGLSWTAPWLVYVGRKPGDGSVEREQADT